MRFTNTLIVILALIAAYVAANLILGYGPKWYAITAYWVVLTVKNCWDVRNIRK